jgi:hypothetical protein
VLATRGRNLPVMEERDVVHRLMRVATLGAADPGQGQRWLTGHPCRLGTEPVSHCPLEDRMVHSFLGVARGCSI